MNKQEHDLEKQRLRELLESQHHFPGSYTFKVIYRSEEGMTARICDAIGQATGIDIKEDDLSVRESSSANFLSMTLEIEVQSAQDVLDVYEVLSKVENIVSWF